MTEVVNLHKEQYDVYIGRGNGGDAHMGNTPIGERGWLGNPVTLSDASRAEAIGKFKELFHQRIEHDKAFRDAVHALKGKRLGCFCSPKPCHGDVIAEYLETQ